MNVELPADPTLWLPHRAPFLLLDEITELVPGSRAAGTWRPSASSWWFEGHFPGRPTVPGVLLVEAMAQCGGVAVMADERFAGLLPLLAGVEHARFRRQVVPGEELRLECHLTRLSVRGGKGEGRAYVDGELAAEAEVLFVAVSST